MRPTAETEAGFQRAVIELAELMGWRWFHDADSRRNNPGFPDLILVRERVLYRELKTQKGRVRPAQREWLIALNEAGADARIWRPADWPEIEATLTAPMQLTLGGGMR